MVRLFAAAAGVAVAGAALVPCPGGTCHGLMENILHKSNGLVVIADSEASGASAKARYTSAGIPADSVHVWSFEDGGKINVKNLYDSKGGAAQPASLPLVYARTHGGDVKLISQGGSGVVDKNAMKEYHGVEQSSTGSTSLHHHYYQWRGIQFPFIGSSEGVVQHRIMDNIREYRGDAFAPTATETSGHVLKVVEPATWYAH